MSLHPSSVELVPGDTARVARAAFPAGNLYLRMRDEVGPLFADDDFVDLFATRGRPADRPRRRGGSRSSPSFSSSKTCPTGTPPMRSAPGSIGSTPCRCRSTTPVSTTPS